MKWIRDKSASGSNYRFRNSWIYKSKAHGKGNLWVFQPQAGNSEGSYYCETFAEAKRMAKQHYQFKGDQDHE